MSEEVKQELKPIENELDVPKEVEEVINKLPERDQHIVKKSFMMAISGGSPINPMVEKMTNEHITQTLLNAEAESKREYELISQDKKYAFWIVVIAFLFVLILCVVFRNNIENVKDILIPMVAFIGGYGFGSKRKAND